MDFGLKDNVILITGAASGMGQAAARLLNTSGAKLVLTDVNGAGLSAVGRELASVGVQTLELDSTCHRLIRRNPSLPWPPTSLAASMVSYTLPA